MKKSTVFSTKIIQPKAYFLFGLLSLFSGTILAADLSTYNPNTGLLTVQDYYDKGNNKHYYLELRYQGNNFLLSNGKLLSAPSGFQQPAYSNQPDDDVMTIPYVKVNQQYYSVDLTYKGNYIFALTRAEEIQPPAATQPTNPQNDPSKFYCAAQSNYTSGEGAGVTRAEAEANAKKDCQDDTNEIYSYNVAIAGYGSLGGNSYLITLPTMCVVSQCWPVVNGYVQR